MRDNQYQSYGFKLNEQPHHYPSNIHLISDPLLTTHLTDLCANTTLQPVINNHIRYIYSGLMALLLNTLFPRRAVSVNTRMSLHHPKEGVYHGQVLDPETPVVVVDIARAGMLPSQVCFDYLNNILNPNNVRQDHILLNRKTNDKEQVIGSNLGGYKIGGSVEDAIVIVPDPMGATGTSMVDAVKLYRSDLYGKPKMVIALHLIITPEYIRYVSKEMPHMQVYALRLDRGLSDQKVLETVPGTHFDRERGLNDKHYIVPGAGGLGEIINNSFV